MTEDFMNLKLCTYAITDVVFDKRSVIADGVVRINKGEIEEKLIADSKFKKVHIDIARPGEMVRIIHVLDVIEPRAKFGGDLRIFPGFLGPPATVGSGVTHRLENLAVINTGDFQAGKSAEGPSSVSGPRERIIDMTGEAAFFSAYSETINVVLNFEPSPDISVEEFDDAIRRAGLWVAEYLAKLSVNVSPDHIETLQLTNVDNSDLPRVAYIYQHLTGIFLRDTFLYGENFPRFVPTIIHPNEIADGAIVNGSLSFAASPTYAKQNHRIIKNLYDRHGKELNFVGVILSASHHGTNEDKAKGAYYAAKLAKMLGADGLVSTQEGGGNSILDQMLTVKFCEDLGIKTVAVTYEMGGSEGSDVPLIYHTKEADALVSTGNREQIVHLPKMERALGGTHILYKNIPATESYDSFMTECAFSFDQTGFWRVRAWDY